MGENIQYYSLVSLLKVPPTASLAELRALASQRLGIEVVHLAEAADDEVDTILDDLKSMPSAFTDGEPGGVKE